MKDSTRHSLLNKANVIAVGMGQKWTNGKNTGEEAILVFVSEKKSKTDLSDNDIIPKDADNIKTDVVGKCGEVKALANTTKVRPVPGGHSVGHLWVTAGTLGGWFKDKDGELVGLSNNHVLAATNRGRKWNPNNGTGHWTIQPGIHDDKKWRKNKIGNLKDFVTISRSGNFEDSAICRLDDTNTANLIVENIGEINDFNLNPFVGQQIQKSGRTTGLTEGSIIATSVTIRVQYDNGIMTFDDQIIANNKSAGGDSGSLLFDMNNNVVGLLFAGSNTITVYNKIERVKNSYGLEIIKEDSGLIEESGFEITVDGEPFDHSFTARVMSGAVDAAKNIAKSGKKVEIKFNYTVEMKS